MVSYPIDQGVKKVYYWAARSTGGEFTPGSEVDELIWLPRRRRDEEDSITRHDRKMLRHFGKATGGHTHRAGGPARHRRQEVTLLRRRHQTTAGQEGTRAGRGTGSHSCWPSAPPTCMRPTGVRCHQTVEPLAEELGVTVHNEPALTEEAYAKNPKRGRHRMLRIAEQDGTPVICTQGKVIPDLIAWWCERDGVRPDKSRNHKGSTWVLSLSGGRLVAADHIGGALAANVRA